MREDSKHLTGYLGAGYVLIDVVTWEEERALALVREAAKALSRPVTVWTTTSGFGNGGAAKLEDALDALSRIQATADARVFVLPDFHRHLEDPAVIRRLRETARLMEGRQQGIVMITPLACIPVELEKEILILDLAPPDPTELGRVLDESVKAVGHGGRLAKEERLRESVLRAAHGLTEREFRRMMRRLLLAHPDFGEEHVKEVLEEKRQVIRRSELLEFYEVDQRLEDVGGLDLLKQWLSHRAEAFGERARRYGLPEPKGLLLLGVQGCGKSLSARAVSGLWRIPLIRLDISAIMDREAEGDQMRRSLKTAESLSPCVLWIDEIEKGFSTHRVTGSQEHGRMARAFSTFLVWLQEKKSQVYVIATANSIVELPPELIRKGRFDEIFFVDLPRDTERAEIFRIHLIKRGRDPEQFNLVELAKACEGFSGSEIEQAVVSAMYEAFTEKREVETRDIVRALRETVPLSETMEESIKELRDWAKHRARPASLDTKLMDLLHGQDQGA